ncbi:MAG: anti-sigma-factor antagonist domain protein [Polaromonas sp.]|nr:anti-sigma-factor antagonist domain protein [Polaromonas sp.]
MLKLPAVLTHAQATGFSRTAGQEVLSQPAQVLLDASELQQFDSSALAVLLNCRRQALAAGKTFAVSGMPQRLLQLAGVYGVDELIPAAAGASVPAA